jgi:hypothetical protein
MRHPDVLVAIFVGGRTPTVGFAIYELTDVLAATAEGRSAKTICQI